MFVSPDDLRTSHAATGGFLEWAEFLGNLYGTPARATLRATTSSLEIDVQGARQVLGAARAPWCSCWSRPSPEAQRERLRGAGRQRRARGRGASQKGRGEMRVGRVLAGDVVVNDDVEQAVDRGGRYSGLRTAAGAGGAAAELPRTEDALWPKAATP